MTHPRSCPIHAGRAPGARRRSQRLPVLGLAALLGLGSALALWPGAARANPEALQVLLAGASGGPNPAAAPAAALPQAARVQVTVRRGETLQDVIRRHLRDTPYSEAFLRQAVMQLNPTAFAGSPHRLNAGAVLQLPTSHDLRQLADGAMPGAAAGAPAGALAAGPGHASTPEDRKQWVRFP